jgi:predicted nucleic acid-binding protein
LRVYLNTSALNRPFDDLSRDRVRLEAEAVAVLLTAIERHAIERITSEYLEFEVTQIPDPERRHRVASLVALAAATVPVSQPLANRARELERQGLRGLDALHVAGAESARCDCLLTTDDRMVRRATRAGDAVRVAILTPMRAVEALPRERKR